MKEMVRVLLNDRCLRNAVTGVGRYVTELVRALAACEPDIDVVPFYSWLKSGRKRGRVPRCSAGSEHLSKNAPFSEPVGKEASVGRYPRLSRPVRRVPYVFRRTATALYDVLMETAGPLAGCRVYHEPNHIPAPWHGPIVTTIHDLSVLRYPQWHPADRVKWYERDFLPSLSRSEHFITVSEFTRSEMISLLGISPRRITAIPLAAREIFQPRPAAQVQAWLRSHRLPLDYLFYVGTIEPRKNLRTVLAGYASLPDEIRRRTPLLLAGMSGWGRDTLDEMIERLRLTGDVWVLGYVNEEALAFLYAGARALLWPSFYEGFGLPPLECMATGTPVICSNRSSLPEVVGDAGVLIEPDDCGTLADAAMAIIDDRDYAAQLRQRSLQRASQFSWAKCAQAHANIYRRLESL